VERAGGVACLLVSAGGLMVALSGRLAARSGIRPMVGRVEHDGTLQPALVIAARAAKLRLLRLAMACFAAFGLLVAIWPRAVLSHETSVAEVRSVGIACALVCGGLLVVRLRYERGRQRIALLASGVCWELGYGASFVAWDDVVGVQVYKVQSAWYLAVGARPERRRDPPRLPWLVRLDRRVSAIPLEAFPVDPEQLGALVRACALEPGIRDGVASERSLAWLAGEQNPFGGSAARDVAGRETLSGA
jgi:hypothetical protein